MESPVTQDPEGHSIWLPEIKMEPEDNDESAAEPQVIVVEPTLPEFTFVKLEPMTDDPLYIDDCTEIDNFPVFGAVKEEPTSPPTTLDNITSQLDQVTHDSSTTQLQFDLECDVSLDEIHSSDDTENSSCLPPQDPLDVQCDLYIPEHTPDITSESPRLSDESFEQLDSQTIVERSSNTAMYKLKECPVCLRSSLERVSEPSTDDLLPANVGDHFMTQSTLKGSPSTSHESRQSPSSIIRRGQNYFCSYCNKILKPADFYKLLAKAKNKTSEETVILQEFHEPERQEYRCDECGKSYSSRQHLVRHQRVHNSGGFSCTECDKTYTQKHNLSIHIKLQHTFAPGAVPFQCTVCLETYTSNGHLKRHLKSHDLQHCLNCGLECPNLPTLRTHMTLAHGGEKEHRCQTCKKIFISREELAGHQHLHVRKPFKCSFCSKRFLSNERFELHVKKVHSIKQYDCELCSKSFTSIVHKKRHELFHSKPHKCDVCNQGFGQKQHLQRHIAMYHDTEKRVEYPCSICSKMFYAVQHLKQHHKIHAKAYKCDTCGRHFSRDDLLQLHQEAHTEEKNLRCKFCDKPFGLLCSLKLHMKRCHNCPS